MVQGESGYVFKDQLILDLHESSKPGSAQRRPSAAARNQHSS
jgi:hypothetical protein